MSTEDKNYLGKGGIGRWDGKPTEGGWIRKLGYLEDISAKYIHDACFTIFTIRFESKMPVELDAIKKTMEIVARKMPYLRLIVRSRNGEQWFKEMDEFKVDVEELTDQDLLEDCSSLMTMRVNHETGPFWFLKFVKHMRDTDATSEEKFKFACFFGFEHCIMDGETNIQLAKVFLETLNRVILGKEIDMKVEIDFVQPYHDMIADRFIRDNPSKTRSYFRRQSLKTFYRTNLTKTKLVGNFTKYFPQPLNEPPSTRGVLGEIDKDTTTALIERCRKENVTLNTAFTAAIYIALYKISLNRDSNMASTNYRGQILVNMRRFWNEEERQRASGFHISTFEFGMTTKLGDISNFWKYARRVQKKVDRDLRRDSVPFMNLPRVKDLGGLVDLNKTFCTQKQPGINLCHMMVSNMGFIDKTFDGSGEVVEATKLEKESANHYFGYFFQFGVHTFRGQLSYKMSYYAQKTTKQTAEMLSKAVIQCLEECTRSS